MENKDKIYISDYIRKHKPLLYERMKHFADILARTGRPLLRTVDLNITTKCNLRCLHCYASEYRKFDMLPLEYWKKAINECKELGAFHFIVQGGEPLFDLDRLEAILRFINGEENFINVISNGILITEENLRWLKSHRVDKICISIDSGNPSEYDKNRNMDGVYNKAVEGLFLAKRLGFQVSISTVATHQNIADKGFQKLVDFARRHKIRVDVQVACPIGEMLGKKEILCDEKDSEYIYRCMRESNFTDDNGQIYLVNRDLYPKYGKSGCPAVKHFISINSYGEILPCTFIHLSLGNIREVSVSDALDKGLRVKEFKEYWDKCLCGEDIDFIDKCIIPSAEKSAGGKSFAKIEEFFPETFERVR